MPLFSNQKFSLRTVILLVLTCALTTFGFACTGSGEVRWEYVVPDNYEGFLAIRFSCPGGEPLIKNGVAHVAFKSNGTFCTSDPWVPSWESTWLPSIRRSPHRNVSGKPIAMPAEIPKTGYALCCEGTTSYCDTTFVVLWVGEMARRKTKSPVDEINFLKQHFDLQNCASPNR
jgi:hypothetical protein